MGLFDKKISKEQMVLLLLAEGDSADFLRRSLRELLNRKKLKLNLNMGTPLPMILGLLLKEETENRAAFGSAIDKILEAVARTPQTKGEEEEEELPPRDDESTLRRR